ncbi:MAG: hypothetical protein CMI56_01785 [Parcubacteria group bacterium]|nr:hypothetical protein [Parcubacteria group bacterium]
MGWDSYSLALCLNELFTEVNGKVRAEKLLKEFPNYENTSKKKREQIAKFFVYGRSLLRPYISHVDTDNMSNAELKNYIVAKRPLRDNNLEGLKATYTNLLKECNLYRNTAPNPSKEVIEIEQQNSIQHMVEESGIQQKADKKCKDGKEPHPITNRCVKKCNKGETRDSSGKCKKNKNGRTVKVAPVKKTTPKKAPPKKTTPKKATPKKTAKKSAQKPSSNKTEITLMFENDLLMQKKRLEEQRRLELFLEQERSRMTESKTKCTEKTNHYIENTNRILFPWRY